MDWKFSCETKDSIPLPPEYTFPQAFNYLNPEKNSFYILECPSGYIQCGGSKESCTVEFREFKSDGGFTHYIFADPAGSDDELHIEMSAGGVHRKKRHSFHFSKAIQLFKCFFESKPWPDEYKLEDITKDFT